jgi:DNA-binding transcriptional LysR family regulator
MNLDDVASFVRVVDLGTISAAAAAEGVPKSTISRRIARLEDALGVELLRRSPRSFALTEDGRLLHTRATGALQELANVEQALSDARETPRGTLVVTAPHDLGRSIAVAELLAQYRARYPEVSVHVRLEERVLDLVAEGVDVALRAHGGDIPGEAGLMTRSLGAQRARLYASPDYLARHEEPSSPAELDRHEVVAHSTASSRTLVLYHSDGTETRPSVSPAHRVNDFGLAQALVQSGAGIGILPDFAANEPEREGRLVCVLRDWSARSAQLSLVWPASRHLAPRVRAFIDLASRRLGAEGLDLARRFPARNGNDPP